jgi:hypothetical protein
MGWNAGLQCFPRPGDGIMIGYGNGTQLQCEGPGKNFRWRQGAV